MDLLHDEGQGFTDKILTQISTNFVLEIFFTVNSPPEGRQWIPIEVNRLGILLKAEQSAHQETKRLGALELEELKAKWKEENDLKLKEVIDSYMKLNLGKDMIQFNLEGVSK